jgi:hypothetical protein
MPVGGNTLNRNLLIGIKIGSERRNRSSIPMIKESTSEEVKRDQGVKEAINVEEKIEENDEETIGENKEEKIEENEEKKMGEKIEENVEIEENGEETIGENEEKKIEEKIEENAEIEENGEETIGENKEFMWTEDRGHMEEVVIVEEVREMREVKVNEVLEVTEEAKGEESTELVVGITEMKEESRMLKAFKIFFREEMLRDRIEIGLFLTLHLKSHSTKAKLKVLVRLSDAVVFEKKFNDGKL